jgi:hypothetical protein
MPRDSSHPLVELVRLVPRGAVTAALIACAATTATAQEPPLPDGAHSATPSAHRQLSAQDSLAIARESAIRDSIFRVYQERKDSLLKARRAAVARAAAATGPPKKSPMLGSPPFFGYTWVFYADVVSGAIIGLALFRTRRRRWSDMPVPDWWAVAAMIAGGIGGACVFVLFFFVAMFAAVLAFFGDGPPPIALFGWTIAPMLLTVLAVTISRRFER